MILHVFVIEEKDSSKTDELSADSSKLPVPKSPTSTVLCAPFYMSQCITSEMMISLDKKSMNTIVKGLLKFSFFILFSFPFLPTLDTTDEGRPSKYSDTIRYDTIRRN